MTDSTYDLTGIGGQATGSDPFLRTQYRRGEHVQTLGAAIRSYHRSELH